MKAIVTGSAGFIGFHVSARLLDMGWQIKGIDNLNAYYDVGLKQKRLAHLLENSAFSFECADVADQAVLTTAIGNDEDADIIIHLAAQAGVRYSIENPLAYVSANVAGQVAVFEAARKMPKVPPVVYASSSSVYGTNTKVPFAESDSVDHPVSVYAATKRSGELLAYSYHHIHGIRNTGLRFFTVYGPWGRPDMAPWLFTDAIMAGRSIKVFNHGDMMRDFTYIDDIVDGVIGAARRILIRDNTIEPVYNLGNNQPVKLGDFIAEIEKATGKRAEKQMLPMPPADVPVTYADITLGMRDLGFAPKVSIDQGIKRFVDWFCRFNGR